MSVDQKVYDLAASFLEDSGATDGDKQDLAEQIQRTIEGAIAQLETQQDLEFAKSERAVTEIPSPL